MAAGASTSVHEDLCASADINPGEMLHTAVSMVLRDEGFSLPTLPAKRAGEAAEKVLEWSTDNKVPWK